MRILVAALALLVSLGAAAKTLRYASQFDPGTMDPHAIASLYNNRVLSQVYETLVGRDTQFRPEPRLALAWTPLDGGRGWRFKLRPGVKFHDGSPFGADDVVFNVERALAPTSAYKTALPGVTGARKVDELTVEILTAQANPTLPLSLTNLRMMGKAWCVAHHVEKPQDYKAKEETYAARNANGTGPYRLERWEPDIKTVLLANPGYWGRHGNVTEAQYLVVTTAATRVSALISGEIDLVIDPAVQDLDRLRRIPGIKVDESTGLATQFLGFDQARTTLVHGDAGGRNPFRDARVREAIRAAIDVTTLNAKVMRGSGATGRAMFSPMVEGFDARFAAPAAYDPARAKALLQEAGYASGFAVDLDCSSQQPADSICQAISGMLTRVGLRIAYRPLPFNQLLPKVNSRDTSMFVIGWTPVTAEAEGVLLPLAHTPGGSGVGEYNFGGYSNPKVDATIDRLRVEFDPAKRRELSAEAMSLLDADAAFVPLVYRNVTWAMRRNVKVQLMPNDIVDLRFLNME
jgi:peptide/nickel transport system substrate-binding protein